MIKNSKKTEAGAEDYTKNMFSDGNNRTATNETIKNAKGYDKAAHTTAEEPEGLSTDSAQRDTSYGRDGTGASGKYDESGGPIGGTEEELDGLEAG